MGIDPDTIQQAAPAVHHAAKHIHQAAPVIHTGISYMTAIISSVISFVVGGGIGWYIGKMGVSRVASEIKNDVTEVKNVTEAAKSAA